MKYTKAEVEIVLFKNEVLFTVQSSECYQVITIETPSPDISHHKCYIVNIGEYSYFHRAWETECSKVEGFEGTVVLFCGSVGYCPSIL